MPDWDYVCGFGDDGGDPDHDIRDPAGHCGNYTSSSRSKTYGPALRCKFCGSNTVYWQMTRTGYRLHNTGDLQLHNCSSTKDMNTEGFDDAI